MCDAFDETDSRAPGWYCCDCNAGNAAAPRESGAVPRKCARCGRTRGVDCRVLEAEVKPPSRRRKGKA